MRASHEVKTVPPVEGLCGLVLASNIIQLITVDNISTRWTLVVIYLMWLYLFTGCGGFWFDAHGGIPADEPPAA